MPELDKAMPGKGTGQTVVSTANSAAHTVKGASTAMDNTQSREQQVEGQKEAIKGGVEVGATAVGAVVGTKLGGNTAMGAQIGNMVGNTVSPVVSEVAQPMLDPVFQAGGKLNDQIREKTGFDVAKSTRQVSSVATKGTEALSSVSNSDGAGLTGKLGSITSQLNQGGKSSGVDAKALLKPQPSFTPQSDEKIEGLSSLKQVKEKIPTVSPLEKAKSVKLDGTGKEGPTPEVDKANKTKLR